jgi:hypothetical protein
MLFLKTYIDPLSSADLRETGGLTMNNAARESAYQFIRSTIR